MDDENRDIFSDIERLKREIEKNRRRRIIAMVLAVISLALSLSSLFGVI